MASKHPKHLQNSPITAKAKSVEKESTSRHVYVEPGAQVDSVGDFRQEYKANQDESIRGAYDVLLKNGRSINYFDTRNNDGSAIENRRHAVRQLPLGRGRGSVQFDHKIEVALSRLIIRIPLIRDIAAHL
jgi:hypothetical protein